MRVASVCSLILSRWAKSLLQKLFAQPQIRQTYAHRAMSKKSKLLAALDAHQGRDYKSEKQKKLQKQAAKKIRTKAPRSSLEEKENAEVQANSTLPMPQDESDGWESDESEAEGETAVCRASVEHL